MEKDADGLALNDPLLFWAECWPCCGNIIYLLASMVIYLTKNLLFYAYLHRLICFQAVDSLKDGKPDVLL